MSNLYNFKDQSKFLADLARLSAIHKESQSKEKANRPRNLFEGVIRRAKFVRHMARNVPEMV